MKTGTLLSSSACETGRHHAVAARHAVTDHRAIYELIFGHMFVTSWQDPPKAPRRRQ
jgi:hypothetical protein